MTGMFNRKILRRLLPAVCGLLLVAGRLCSQASPSPKALTSDSTAESKLPAFEVATIKPTTGGVAGFITYPGGRMQCGMCTLDFLLMFAFDLQPYQIVGAPDWAHGSGYNGRYSIAAIAPESSELHKLSLSAPTHNLTDEQRQMVQSLLIDRFQLRYHREKKIGAVFVLTRGSGPLGLRPPKHADHQPWAGSVAGGGLDGDGIAGENISMPLLAKRLSGVLQCPVLDETGIAGSFDFKYVYSDYDPTADSQNFVPSILSSLQGIGLKLKSAKGPVETIVVDSVERPSPN